ncbi:MAG: hypothetical protein IKJ45_01505 [Kiritimatiellae bacterium]|nr:hypothetical protein [Kiritimatiellia bacterium]
MAHTWRDGYRSTGEHVDAARRMVARARSCGKSVAYCQPYEDRLTPVDRSRILSMSWETAPRPVKCGSVAELRGCDAIVASAYGLDLGTDDKLGPRYHVVDSAGGLSLWVKDAEKLPFRERLATASSWGGSLSVLFLFALVGLFFLAGGYEGVVLGVAVVSICAFLQVAFLHSVDGYGFVVMAVLTVLGVWRLRNKRIEDHEVSASVRLVGGKTDRWFCGAAVTLLFCAYSALALTHTFVSPNGLGTVGGKARVLLLSRGFPFGFFVDPAYMLYQPAYPPGSALVTLGGYLVSGVCDEWLIQLLNCLLMAILAGFFLSCARDWSMRLLVIAFFASPLTVRLATLFYPEVYVGLCMVVGWGRIRKNPLDWTGWLSMGLAGWFKNEGLVYFSAMALVVLLANSRKRMLSVAVRIGGAVFLPVSWHIGCRLCGASLDGYAPMLAASATKGGMAFLRLVRHSFGEPWLYAFAFPIALVNVFRGGMSPVRIVGLSVVVSLFFFCAVFSLSDASDFSWHLASMERLLWVPALLLLQENGLQSKSITGRASSEFIVNG